MLNEFKKEKLRKIVVQSKRKIDSAKDDEELKNIARGLREELLKCLDNVL